MIKFSQGEDELNSTGFILKDNIANVIHNAKTVYIIIYFSSFLIGFRKAAYHQIRFQG